MTNPQNSELIQIRVTRDLKDSLTELAEASGLSVSAYARMLLVKRVFAIKRDAANADMRGMGEGRF